jgi:hypothetical protein
MRFKSGKHEEETISHVLKTDPTYLLWILEKKNESPTYAPYLPALLPIAERIRRQALLKKNSERIQSIRDMDGRPLMKGSPAKIQGRITNVKEKDGKYGVYYSLDLRSSGWLASINIPKRKVPGSNSLQPDLNIQIIATCRYINYATTPPQITLSKMEQIEIVK